MRTIAPGIPKPETIKSNMAVLVTLSESEEETRLVRIWGPRQSLFAPVRFHNV